MTVITGGAYQGKTEYIRETLGISKHDMYFCTGRNIDNGAKAIVGLHIFSYACSALGLEPIDELRRLCPDMSEKIFVSDEISCGVVPVEPLMREWREAHGRMMSSLAKESDSVVRLFCGIPQVIK